MFTDEKEVAALVSRVAREVANNVLEDPRFRSALREAVLLGIVEQQAIRDAGVVRSILRTCHDQGVHIRLDDEGKLVGNLGRLTPDVRPCLTAYREEITRHLEQARHAEHRVNGNGHHAPPNGNGASPLTKGPR